MTTKLVKEKLSESFKHFKGTKDYKNPMEVPRILKVVINVGVGSIKDKKKVELVADRLAKITGQKPSARPAKISIASFKSREGDIVGYQVTLRGAKMFDFLDRFLNVALPRSKDFRGLSSTSLDEIGNLTIGIKEHTIFPETSDEDLKDVFGLAITIVTTARNKEEAKSFFDYLGFPFKKTK